MAGYAQVVMDRDTGRSKGFGFVEMSDNGQLQAAIAAQPEGSGRPLVDRQRSSPREGAAVAAAVAAALRRWRCGGGSRGYGGGGGGKRY